MAVRRVHEVAEEIGISGKALLKLLKDMGYKVSSYMSYIDEGLIPQVLAKLENEKATARKESRFRDKIHRGKLKKTKKDDEITYKPSKVINQPFLKLKEVSKTSLGISPLTKLTKPDRRVSTKKKKYSKWEDVVEEKAESKEIKESIRRTIADISTGKEKKKYKRTKTEKDSVETQVFKVTEYSTVGEFANILNIPLQNVMKEAINLGLIVTINHRLEKYEIELIASALEIPVEVISPADEIDTSLIKEIQETKKDDKTTFIRAPIVTVMGHVDHGKTSILDYIRKTKVASQEAGKITQHIGAYQVTLPDKRKITFIDTPGHEAFTAMRARGAKVTDIVILVISADEGVMPQTVEAIDHAKAAGTPIITAINKIDLPDADPKKVVNQLMNYGIVAEELGGQNIIVEVSAKTGFNIDKLLEMVLLLADTLELKTNIDTPAKGVVIESKMDKKRGPLATILVQEGILKVGDYFVCGSYTGRVRAMFNELGESVKEVLPSTPVEILGFEGLPRAGDSFNVSSQEKIKEISQKLNIMRREKEIRQRKVYSLLNFSSQYKKEHVKDLNLLIKADVDGSLQAISDSLTQFSSEDVSIHIIRSAVGNITETDVLLAKSAKAIIIGFNVKELPGVKAFADKEGVEIRIYNIIFKLLEDIKSAIEGLLEPETVEVPVGEASIKQVFKISSVGKVAGCIVNSGSIRRGLHVNIIRNDEVIGSGKIVSLKRFQEDVKEVSSGMECGIGIDSFKDFQENDIIKAFEIKQIQKQVKSDKIN